jgi:hypothetical protein
MPGRANKSKLAFQRMVAPEPIAASELDSGERILARLVALAYAGDHPDHFSVGTEEQLDPTVPSCPVVTSVAPNGFREKGGTT